LLSGPNQLRVQKNFALPEGGKRVDMPTFLWTARGPLFTFPQRIYIDRPQEVDIPQKDRIFRKALDELLARFTDRSVRRVGVVHELVFDTGQINSLEIVTSNLKGDLWRQRVKNLNLHLETPTDDKNVNIDIRPTQVMRRSPNTPVPTDQAPLFGIIVNIDINNRQVKPNLPKAEINDILAFAGDYVPEELIRFLNNEY